MAHVVKPVDGIAERDKVVDHVHVAAAVFAKPVDDEQHGIDVPSRKPGLMIDVGIPHAFEIAFYMIHRISASGPPAEPGHQERRLVIYSASLITTICVWQLKT